jgi:hypothetical protein
VKFVNVMIAYADSPPFEALGLAKRPALLLGMRDLRALDRVAIDFSTRRILFDLPARQRCSPRGRLRPPFRFARAPTWGPCLPIIQPPLRAMPAMMAGTRCAVSCPICGRPTGLRCG